MTPHDPANLPTPRASDEDKRDPARKGNVLVKERTQVDKPKMYKVLLHNDHYTSMEFVTWVLQTVFRRNEAEATAIMLHIHRNGLGIAGVYSKEVAETKATKTVDLARRNDFPLQCTYEEA
jgi:ATP-dependent Clp protease adaptor protein ClpS